MKKNLTIYAGVLSLVALLLTPAVASASTFILVCEPASEPAPPEWFGGPWLRPLKVRVDTDAKVIELLDQDDTTMAGTLRASRLSGLGGYQIDVTINDRVINWGVLRMWGISGYVDRKTGRIDALWATQNGYSQTTLIRQFHGTCRER
jgi:hypothetical protein